MSNRDRVYERFQPNLVDFAFDERVANVFPDMIRRSVPGYETVITMLGIVAEKFWQPGSRVYDLGCSLGASTLSIHSQLQHNEVEYICVDNAKAMLDQCRSNLSPQISEGAIEFRCEDVENTLVENAGVIVLNFTLQFIEPTHRSRLIKKLHSGLVDGGVLILSEKVSLQPDDELNQLHEKFKSANGYSDLEISQKRSALENVMKLDTEHSHLQRLQQAGFSHPQRWFQSLSFCSYFAVKS